MFILRQHFPSIPSSPVETAKLDGVGPIRFLRSALVPMSTDALVGASVITFVYARNQYLWPVIDTERDHVVQVGLSTLGAGNVTMARTLLSFSPRPPARPLSPAAPRDRHGGSALIPTG